MFTRSELVRAGTSFLIWMLLNITLSITNKWLFVKQGFKFPVFIIIFGTLCTFFGSFVMLFLCRVEAPQLDRVARAKNWKLLLTLGLVHGLDVGLENFSIVYISISLNQVIKATVPAMTLFLSFFFEGKRFSIAMVVSTMVTVAGAIITVFRNPELSNDGHIGVIAAVLSALGAAISTTILGLLLQDEDNKINGLSVGFASSIPSVIALLPPFAAFEYQSLMTTRLDDPRGTWTLLVVVGFVALFYNLSRFYFIKFTEAHYSVLAGNVKVILLVFVSMAVFGHQFLPINFFGMFLSFAGFVSYSFFKYKAVKLSRNQQKLRDQLELIVAEGGDLL